MSSIKKAAVIGSGVMGKGIAAHLANCGIPSLLLDIDRALVEKGVAELPKVKPALLYDSADLSLIRAGTIADNLAEIAECDWIVEVIIEQLAPKQALYEKIEKYVRPGQVVSSNTSGIAWSRLVDGRSKNFREQFCITHFFNPVRYLKLVELVGGADTNPAVLVHMETFLRDVMGKGVVRAKDTPNFIANRIGVQGMMVAMHALVEKNWRPEIVDKVMGPAVGRPKSACFRTADIVGLDTLAHVARTTVECCATDESRDLHRLPAYVEKMVAEKMLGDKTGKGFYQKSKGADGGTEILALNVQTLQYEPQQKVKTPSLGAVRDMENPAERIRTVVWADDDAGNIAWPLVSASLVYAANRVPEIADDILAVDSAMEWGFGWEIGPFATWDALGVKNVVARLEKEGRAVPELVKKMLAKGIDHFYTTDKGVRSFLDLHTLQHRVVPQSPGVLLLPSLKEQERTVFKNESGALVDLGDGVLACEFHTKMNAIDEGIINLVNEGIDRAEKNGTGLVLYNDGANFCAGANLMLVFLEAQQKNWDKIDAIVRQFQGLCQRMRFAKKPIVAAPFQLALGGGCEFTLGATQVRAHAETYIGLVELGVGLIPAGAGCKNMLLQCEAMQIAERHPRDQIWMSPRDGGPFPKVRRAFESIGYAKVATSAKEAKNCGYFSADDNITIDRARLLGDAKADVLALAKNYTPPPMRTDISLPGAGGYYALVNAIAQARLQGLVTEYDQVLGEKLAHILTGGNHPNVHLATEDDILARERETFLSLCGDERTQARIQHMLMNGKPLRN